MGNKRNKRKDEMINLLKQYEDDENYWQNLHPHILFQIFAKLSQEDLLELRCTCKSWNKEATWSKFIAQNFLQSKPALLIQTPVAYRSRQFKSKLLELDDEGLGFKLKKFGMSRMGHVMSTCNGLILVRKETFINRSTTIRELQVVNMVTKCKVTIPNCPSGCQHGFCCLVLVFNPHEKHYKVVHISSNRFGFEIFTLGCPSNEWKVIPGPFQDEPYDRSWKVPVSSSGQFLHWDLTDSKPHILSMDICDETTWKTPVLCDYVSFHEKRLSLIELRVHLSFMYSYTTTQFDVWILKDVRGQNWQRSYSILAESINNLLPRGASPIGEWRNPLPDFEKLLPICSLRKGDVIVFQHLRSLCVYLYETNLKVLRKLKELPIKDYYLLPYKSSLVCWQNAEELLFRQTI